MNYKEFISNKSKGKDPKGFDALWIPDFLFDFQKYLTEWAIKQGRCALFEDCGLGKGPQALVWSENIIRKTNKNVLILTPLAVSPQMVREGDKFGIEVRRSQMGTVHKGITVTNYERLKYFNPKDFVGIVADESSILKNFDGKTRVLITNFMKDIQYRLLCTATPAPNDNMELGTSSEALGEMKRGQMLGTFFINDGETTSQWRLKEHAKKEFWRWMSSWSRAMRFPSDLGFDDGDFKLPKLNTKRYTVPSTIRDGFFVREAKTLNEQRAERKRTLNSRCEKVAEILPTDRPCIAWCHLNPEGDLLTKLIPDAVQVAGSDRDEVKEERLEAFSQGEIRVLVTKPKIACFGLNWQHCADVAFFPSNSQEQYYQAIRRCWRFGQKNEVNCSIISSEAEKRVIDNMLRKEKQAIEMYNGIVKEMGSFVRSNDKNDEDFRKVKVPLWLK